jgi:hypothetical protein
MMLWFRNETDMRLCVEAFNAEKDISGDMITLQFGENMYKYSRRRISGKGWFVACVGFNDRSEAKNNSFNKFMHRPEYAVFLDSRTSHPPENITGYK